MLWDYELKIPEEYGACLERIAWRNGARSVEDYLVQVIKADVEKQPEWQDGAKE